MTGSGGTPTQRTADRPSAAPRSSKGRVALLATGLVLVALSPVIVFELVGWGAAANAVVLTGFTGLMTGYALGRRDAVLVTIITAALLFIAYPMASHAIGAGVVMAVVAFVYGLSARRGATSSVVCAPIAVLVTLTLPPAEIGGHGTMATAAVIASGALVGGFWAGAAGLYAARRVPHAAPQGVSVSIAWVYSVVLAIVAGLAMGIVLGSGVHKGGEWLVLTLFIVGQPNEHGTFMKSLERLGGTAIGFGIVAIVALTGAGDAIVIPLAVIFAIAAVAARLTGRPYWQYVIVLTPAVVFAEGAGSDVLQLDVVRLEYTVLGSLIAIAVLAGIHFASERFAWLNAALRES